ncbi:MAG: SapC family protein, partial [Nevskiaceae bacterium]|nr:SapC family protein [Nevskiaceae bacterium]
GFAKTGYAIPLTVVEFTRMAATAPIIFVGDDKVPIAAMGLNAGQNLFIRDDGTFESWAYIPAYIRRYPFVFAEDAANKQLVLCIDRAAEFITDEGYDRAFFEASGEPTEYTRNCLEFCNNFEGERQRTSNFVQLLKDLDLFEKKTATFTPRKADGTQGESQMLAEYFGVSEEKLRKLPADKLAELRDNDALSAIYAHLHSLFGWDRLVAMAVNRATAKDQAAADASR